MIYQYYDPHPHICRMRQYKCCKNYKDICPLWDTCSKMDIKKLISVCKRDCASCSYEGCTMPMEKRKDAPLYVNRLVTVNMLDLHIERNRERERQDHRKEHRKLYIFYNTIWGDYREKKNKKCREKYHTDLEFSREQARKRQRKYYKKHPRVMQYTIIPECRLDCEKCKYDDCILPDNWRVKARQEKWKKKNPNYSADYREKNREKLRRQNREHYAKNKELINARKREKRKDPEVKQRYVEYYRQYREANREKIRENQKRYRDQHGNKRQRRKRFLEKSPGSICLCPQYTYCGRENCSLAKYCSVFPLTSDIDMVDAKTKRTSSKKVEHQKYYQVYRKIFQAG